MDTNDNLNINDLLGRPLWQLSCREYVELMRYALSQNTTVEAARRKQATGTSALAREIGCAPSTLYGIMRNVDFSPALISRIGRRSVYDIECARKLANDYMMRMREERRRGA